MNYMEMENIKSFLCTIEGIKIRFKNLHWNSEIIEEHRWIDEVSDIINGFEDEIAEVYQGIYGSFNNLFLESFTANGTNSHSLLSELVLKCKEFYITLPDIKENAGMMSKIEDFIDKLMVKRYLLNMIKQEEYE